MLYSAPLAIIIEPNLRLADTLFEILATWRFDVLVCMTHSAAADAGADRMRVDLLAACHPASEDDSNGAYMAECRALQGGVLPVVIMVSDPQSLPDDAPTGAVQIVKPFTTAELRHAIVMAGARAL